MFEKALVGVDHRQGGRDAIALAKQLAPRAEFTLAHVYAMTVPATRGGGLVIETELDRAREILRQRREEASVNASVAVCAGSSVGTALHELANDSGADLIVIGSCHRGPLGRVLNGDDARATLHGAPCAVAIAPAGYAERAEPIAQIGVGFNGSPESARAFAAAQELAGRHRAQLKAMSVVWLPPAPAAGPDTDEHPSAAWKRMHEQFQSLPGSEGIEDEIGYGDSDKALADFSEGLDLLVVGSRGQRLLARLLNGSTSDYLARHTHSPLLVVPGAAAGERADAPDGKHGDPGRRAVGA